MPVGATTTTLRSVWDMNRRISVDFPVPALPVRKTCLPCANRAMAARNSSVSTNSRAGTRRWCQIALSEHAAFSRFGL